MNIHLAAPKAEKGVTVLARSGLVAKGFVYVLLGVLAVMAAFELGGQSSKDTDTTGVLNFLNDSFAGKWLLPLLAVGLFCYSAWRFIQAFRSIGRGQRGWRKATRYLVSGLVYLFFSFSAFKIVLTHSTDNGDSQHDFASDILSKPFGQWLLGIASIIIAAVGVYQIYYGLSEKYKKHVQKMNLRTSASSALLTAGKIGYLARGFVWLLLSYLMLQAVTTGSSSKAGDTGKAFEFLETSPMGSYLLGAVGLGLIAYGLFNFIRARYETFN